MGGNCAKGSSGRHKTSDQVTAGLAQYGIESSNFIVGIDFTRSNEWTGAASFNKHSLHTIGNVQNPYERVISIIGRTVPAFDGDNLIPCFGFGDASTQDQDVFSFYPDETPCNGFEDVLRRYRDIVPCLKLAGPTSFAPIIEKGISIVEKSRGNYHVLLIIADGQVTRSVDTPRDQLSPQEQITIDAIVKASKYPLSIILVGVGDGPWDMMREFLSNISAQAFDNFKFVNFTRIMSKEANQSSKEAEFVHAALMELPAQYEATIRLGILGLGASSRSLPQHGSLNSGNEASAPSFSGYNTLDAEDYAPYPTSTYDNQVCPICLTNRKDMAFGCGHQTCCECGVELRLCPICRCLIQTRIKLY